MTENTATPPNLEMPTVTDLVIKHLKTYREMKYIKIKNIDESILQKPRKKDFYE